MWWYTPKKGYTGLLIQSLWELVKTNIPFRVYHLKWIIEFNYINVVLFVVVILNGIYRDLLLPKPGKEELYHKCIRNIISGICPKPTPNSPSSPDFFEDIEKCSTSPQRSIQHTARSIKQTGQSVSQLTSSIPSSWQRPPTSFGCLRVTVGMGCCR